MNILVLGVEMKNLIFVIVLVVAGIGVYNLVNKPVDETNIVEVEAVDVETSEAKKGEIETTEAEDENLKTPADMSEEGQTEMYGFMMEYNKCMMENKVAYHQADVNTEQVAGETLDGCEPHLGNLKEVLVKNEVNENLREGMVITLRQRAARKLMSRIMQTQAATLMAADANPLAAPTMP
ncbi:MAG: hypothetical protein COA90_05330 [Gammaproteobacteria bacterium]|nr:MAG: hypothetical protein COA90_05330 [Gammaproteobacteria bacterium]